MLRYTILNMIKMSAHLASSLKCDTQMFMSRTNCNIFSIKREIKITLTLKLE